METNNGNPFFKNGKSDPDYKEVNIGDFLKNLAGRKDKVEEEMSNLDKIGKRINESVVKAIKINPIAFSEVLKDQLGPIPTAGMLMVLMKSKDPDPSIVFVIGKIYELAVEWNNKIESFDSQQQQAIFIILKEGKEYIEKLKNEATDILKSGESNVLGNDTDHVDELIDSLLKKQRSRNEVYESAIDDIEKIKKEFGIDDKSFEGMCFADIKHREENKIREALEPVLEQYPSIRNKMLELLQAEFDDVLTMDDIDKYKEILQRCLVQVKTTNPDLEGLNVKHISSSDIMTRIAKKHVSLYSLITTRDTFEMEGFDHLIPAIDSIIFAILAEIDKDFAKAIPDIEQQTKRFNKGMANPLIELAGKLSQFSIEDLLTAVKIAAPRQTIVKPGIQAVLDYMIKMSKRK